LGRAISPGIRFARDAREQIDSHFEDGGRIILASSHVSMMDPLVLASVVQREEVLHPLRGNVVIPAKSPLYTDMPYRLFRRPLFDNFVAVPTFRRKDSAKTGLPAEEAETLLRQANAELVSLLTNCANQGINVAIFPDGERVKPGTNDEIRSGIGRIACGLDDPDRFLIQPVGINYDVYGSKRTPSVFAGNPYTVARSESEVTTQTEWAIRGCEAAAFTL
jgi:1-acyl-sn-glycerol-3-phosphate acyltransferase